MFGVMRNGRRCVAWRGSTKTVCQMPLVVVYHCHCLPTGCCALSMGSSTRKHDHPASVGVEGIGHVKLERRVAAFVMSQRVVRCTIRR